MSEQDYKAEVERLRAQARHYEEGWKAWRDEEERLRDENEQLRANIVTLHNNIGEWIKSDKRMRALLADFPAVNVLPSPDFGRWYDRVRAELGRQDERGLRAVSRSTERGRQGPRGDSQGTS